MALAYFDRSKEIAGSQTPEHSRISVTRKTYIYMHPKRYICSLVTAGLAVHPAVIAVAAIIAVAVAVAATAIIAVVVS